MNIGNVKVGDTPRTAVIVTDTTSSEVLQNLRLVGVDFVELRIDKCQNRNIDAIINTIRRIAGFGFPVIATIRIPEEGGDVFIEDSEREKIFRSIISDVDAIDIEFCCADLIHNLQEEIKSHNKTLIISYHNFKETPDFQTLHQLITDGKSIGGDIVKISTFANETADMICLLQVTWERANEGLISISLGPKGMPSRVFFPLFGSLISYGFIEEAAAPGQIDIYSLIKYIKYFCNK